MALMMTFHTGNHLSEQKDVHSSIHVPMVYERVPVEPVHWEYRVLTVDAREEDLPDAARLNELGAEGWLLVGVLDQRATGRSSIDNENEWTRASINRLVDQGVSGRSSLVHYYFVRQRSE
jgi:hypothetical protein